MNASMTTQAVSKKMKTREEEPCSARGESTPRASLLTLPAEIRMQIYSEIFPDPLPTPCDIVDVSKRGIKKHLMLSSPWFEHDDEPRITNHQARGLQLTSRLLYLETSGYLYASYAWRLTPQVSRLIPRGLWNGATRIALTGSVGQLKMLVKRIGQYHAACIEEVHVDLLAPMVTAWNYGYGVDPSLVERVISWELTPFADEFKKTFPGLKRLVVVQPQGSRGVPWLWVSGSAGERTSGDGPGRLRPLSEADLAPVRDLQALWEFLRDMFFDWVKGMPRLRTVVLDFDYHPIMMPIRRPIMKLLVEAISLVDGDIGSQIGERDLCFNWLKWEVPKRFKD